VFGVFVHGDGILSDSLSGVFQLMLTFELLNRHRFGVFGSHIVGVDTKARGMSVFSL